MNHRQTLTEQLIEKVKSAIDFIRMNEGENAIITANKILLYSQMSRTVLYKNHVLRVWNEPLWNRRYGRKHHKKYVDKELKALQSENETLLQKMQKAEARIKKLETELEDGKALAKGQEVRLRRLEDENSILRGEKVKLISKLSARGVI
jgi:chromosome segregation ATPase